MFGGKEVVREACVFIGRTAREVFRKLNGRRGKSECYAGWKPKNLRERE